MERKVFFVKKKMGNHRRKIRSFTRRHKNRPSPKRSPKRSFNTSSEVDTTSVAKEEASSSNASSEVDTTSVAKEEASSSNTSLEVDTTSVAKEEASSSNPRTPSPRTLKFDREDRKVCDTLDGLFYEPNEEEEEEVMNKALLQETANDFTEQVMKKNFDDIYAKLSESLDVLRNSKSSDDSTKRNIEFLTRSVLELSSRAAFSEFHHEIDDLNEAFGARLITQNQYIRYLKRRTLCHAIGRVFGSRGESNLMKHLAFRSWIGFVAKDRERTFKEMSLIRFDQIFNRKRLSRMEYFFRVWVDATSRLDVTDESLSEITLSRAKCLFDKIGHARQVCICMTYYYYYYFQ